MIVGETRSVDAQCDITLLTLGPHRSHYPSLWTHTTSPLGRVSARPVLVVVCIKSGNVCRCKGRSPYSPGWSGLHFENKQKHSHHLTQQTLNCFQMIICKLVNGKVACPSYNLSEGATWTQKVYDLQIPLAKCKNNIPTQRIFKYLWHLCTEG